MDLTVTAHALPRGEAGPGQACKFAGVQWGKQGSKISCRVDMIQFTKVGVLESEPSVTSKYNIH